MTRSTRLKVCCIQDEGEARVALEHGASAVGLVAAMPSGPGPISEAQIALVARFVGARAETFLLTALVEAAAIAEQHARCGTSTIQLVDHVEPRERAALRALLPGVALVQVIHVTGPESVDEARAGAEHADALLLDSGNREAVTKELGGTGRVHDWSVSRLVVESVRVPVWLAGGLRPQNVAEAVALVRPHGVDLCTGVRTDGRLDPTKLGAFVRALRGS
ncbi:MAG: phosphoribosylanthranilate isomerase [Planctomycetota bacterium]|nr:phosphoribosylanthranilate isomerase [Planctomycetota bacterium]